MAIKQLLLIGFIASILVNLLSSNNDVNTAATRSLRILQERQTLGPAETLLERCYKKRFNGYWDFKDMQMRAFDSVCDDSMEKFVQAPLPKNDAVMDQTTTKMYKDTDPKLFEQLEGACILLLGDSTDRQLVETWCSRWDEQDKTQMWMPENFTFPSGTDKERNEEKRAGFKCRAGNFRNNDDKKTFTFGSYFHYGVAPPPYWKFAHTYNPNINWGNTTDERVTQDVPKYFQKCHQEGHSKFNVVIVQSYFWDLARQWYLYNTERPPPEMIRDWSHNATKFVKLIRTTLPNVTVAWAFRGSVRTGGGIDSQAIHDMNQAILALDGEQKLDVDFFADYGAVLDSALAHKKKEPYPMHPPPVAQSGYINILMNALVTAYNITNGI
jgi:hypothetical protein